MAAPPSRAGSPPGGFTLIELIVVISIVSLMFVLVPMNMESWGREKLNASANSLVAALGQARTQAIYDGWPATLELGLMRGAKGESEDARPAWRVRFTNQVAGTELDAATPEDRRRLEDARERERLDLWTDWIPLPDGIELVGVSKARGEWRKPNAERPIEIGFTADGNVEGPVAIRIEMVDLDVRREFRTATILVNALTSLATWSEGEHDVEAKRPAAEFQR